MSIARDIIALTSSIAFEYYSDIGSADHYLHKILLFLPQNLHISEKSITFALD